MTEPKSDLAYLRNEKAKAEQKLRSCQHREKILERRMSELNRRERVHRLCTRAGMLESFLVCPGELTDDQVMELLKISFRQPEVVLALAKISIGAERQRRYRATKKLRAVPTGEHLWEVVLMYQKVRFKTYSGLPFSYEIRKGRSGEYTRDLWIDRRENSKSLAWSSVLLALGNVKEVGAVVDRPKALGDIRGVTYIYGMFYRFGLIDVPDDAKRKMNKNGCVSKG